MLGPAPVVDFDGTVARLHVRWSELRGQLAVERIDDLWDRQDADVWRLVTEAEVRAAATAEPVSSVLDELSQSRAFAVLTSNSADAVWRFVSRFDTLAERLITVVGREQLNGPKSVFATFAAGYATCVAATAPTRSGDRVVYLGDMDYELEYAQALGAAPIKVARDGTMRLTIRSPATR
jgi:phosphoglycolate phosphatase-like HAD superfamily hydrolase